MKIRLNSVLVGDQDKALRFYTDTLGFQKKMDTPVGEFRWLTVVSPDELEAAELVQEPNAHPAAATFQQAMYEASIPLAAFQVDNINLEHERLTKLGVEFRTKPTDFGDATIALVDDTCGNLVQLYQPQ